VGFPFLLGGRHCGASMDEGSRAQARPRLVGHAASFIYSRRIVAVRWCCASISKPIYVRPSCFAATSVEPEPANESSTTPPGGQKVEISGVNASIGFCVGCSLLPVYRNSITSGMGCGGGVTLPFASK